MARYYLNRTGSELQVFISLDPEYKRILSVEELTEAFVAILGFTSRDVVSDDEIRAALEAAIENFNVVEAR